MLLIAGGLLDLNLQALADTATAMGIAWVDWRTEKDASPLCHWDLDAHEATLPWGADGPCPRGAFIRQDIFASLSDPRPEVAQRASGWFTAVQGWLLAQGVRHFNADISARAFNKPAALVLARQHGLTIPATWVSNDTARMKARAINSSIAKPVAGGGLCQTLEEALAHVDVAYSAMPALIQPRLVAPEIRLFVVGDDAHAFRVDSPSLDYRAEHDAEVTSTSVPAEVNALRALMKTMRMDFGAADFKTDPHTGKLVFLELNTSPMFARFDMACDGALTRSMVKYLVA